MTYDYVNPDHYKGDRKFEPIAVIEDWGLNYHLGNALKYIARNGRKPGEDPCEGLSKAIWYLERLQDQYRSQEPVNEFADMEYTEILRYYGESADLEEAWPEKEELLPFEPVSYPAAIEEGHEDDWEKFWHEPLSFEHTETSTFVAPRWDGPVGADGTDLLWDPSVGPLDLTEAEIEEALGKKDLDQFEDDQIVSVIEKRGFLLGVLKDGSTCELDSKEKRCL